MFYGCCHEETHEINLNVTGVQFSRLQISAEISQFRPSEIHYLQDPTARNGSLDM